MRSGTACEMFGEIEVRRRRERRVAAKDDQQLNPLLLHIVNQLPQRLRAVAGPGIDRRDISYCLSDIAEPVVQRVRQQVDRGRLPVAGEDQAPSAMGLEVFGDRGNPFFVPLDWRRPPADEMPNCPAIALASVSISLARSGRR